MDPVSSENIDRHRSVVSADVVPGLSQRSGSSRGGRNFSSRFAKLRTKACYSYCSSPRFSSRCSSRCMRTRRTRRTSDGRSPSRTLPLGRSALNSMQPSARTGRNQRSAAFESQFSLETSKPLAAVREPRRNGHVSSTCGRAMASHAGRKRRIAQTCAGWGGILNDQHRRVAG